MFLKLVNKTAEVIKEYGEEEMFELHWNTSRVSYHTLIIEAW